VYIPGELGVVWYGELAALYSEGALPEWQREETQSVQQASERL